MQFKPTLELKMLPQLDVKVVSCSGDANYNGCNGAGGKGDACIADSAPFLTESDASISGRHYNCWAVAGDDAGTDTYQVTLAHDWTPEELTFEKFVEAGEGWVKSPSGFSAGQSQWKAKIEWSVTPLEARHATFKEALVKARAEGETARRAFLDKQHAALAAENARVRAEIARLRASGELPEPQRP